jgi:HSP20 family molecular chaperone IbpA
MTRNLQLARRETFFNDPFFADIMSLQDSDMHKKLDVFKQKSLLGIGKGEAAHNLQVTASNDKFMVQLELPGFAPEDFSLKTKDDVIVLEALHDSKEEESTSRKYVKELKLPEGVCRDQLASSYSAEGILTISAPRVIKAPEGAEVEESMAAASKAYTTDDGTAVKQDSQQASQKIAASTVSADGTSTSSMSFSSSSSSSSTATSSSSGGPMPSLMGDMGSMMGGGQMAVDMDMESMMAKMRGDMKLGGGSLMSGGDMSSMMSSSSSKKMSSSSMMSSSSSSSSSTQMGSTMLGGGMQMPSLMGNMGGMGSLDIEELSTAGTDFSGPPEYTVQSPRPSVVAGNVAGEMKHRVQAAADYKAADSKEADHTVLLKLKEGDEYKLVLNMQNYSPENITVKLNDDASVITVSAIAGAGSTDDFKQTHKVPPGIDLDQMTSSFSSDGILVIKAPRKK